MTQQKLAFAEEAKREPPDFRECFQFDPEQRTAEAAAARKKISPRKLRSSYVADLNGYRVTQDMLRHPSGPPFTKLVQIGQVVRTNYSSFNPSGADIRVPFAEEKPYIVEGIHKFEDYGVECYSLTLSDTDGRRGYSINELVAVDGKMLHLFLANEDAVFVDNDYQLPQPKLLFDGDFREERDETDDL